MVIALEDLAKGIVAGQRHALARALSLAERDRSSTERLLSLLADRLGRAHVVGVTGPPGAGKSTLVGVMVQALIEMGLRVAVLAVDPSSPVTGGALLGDRFRIGEAFADDRSFIRSTATRGSLGGLTRAAGHMIKLMDAAGFNIVVVETVGTGQSDIDIVGLADSTLVVFPPGLGDELQAIKAGILELADLLVVTKSDTEAAKLACQALKTVAPLWRRAPPIHLVSAMTGEGIAELAATLIARVRDISPLKQGRNSIWPLEKPSVIESFQKLWNDMENCFSAEMTSGLSYQILNTEEEAKSSGLKVMCTASLPISSFQLGAVAGALLVSAANLSLNCSIDDSEISENRLHFLLNFTDQESLNSGISKVWT
ncbi:MAG: methylmalonyl Co-A mutase-associated GTPase MeaB [Sulfuritalea sp.]|nr:methylmalonyl Co-A mutase-associated GTPase MeaB [Sulfuritalea sp.]